MAAVELAGERIGIFGTGVMAHGIAHLCLAHRLEVVILSSSAGRAAALAATLRKETAEGRVLTGDDELPECSLFLEATVESVEAKHAVLQRVEAHLRADALMATTTSSLSITELAGALQDPERFLGLHFFNPVARMKLVEVVAGVRTTEDTVERGRHFAEGIGKRPLRLPDRAGFLVNRLLIPYLNQAARLVENGVATAEDVDRAMTLGAGHPLGPLGLIDLIGADVCQAIGASLFEEFRQPSQMPPPELRRRVALGLLGRKTGQGYHHYAGRRG